MLDSGLCWQPLPFYVLCSRFVFSRQYCDLWRLSATQPPVRLVHTGGEQLYEKTVTFKVKWFFAKYLLVFDLHDDADDKVIIFMACCKTACKLRLLLVTCSPLFVRISQTGFQSHKDVTHWMSYWKRDVPGTCCSSLFPNTRSSRISHLGRRWAALIAHRYSLKKCPSSSDLVCSRTSSEVTICLLKQFFEFREIKRGLILFLAQAVRWPSRWRFNTKRTILWTCTTWWTCQHPWSTIWRWSKTWALLCQKKWRSSRVNFEWALALLWRNPCCPSSRSQKKNWPTRAGLH